MKLFLPKLIEPIQTAYVADKYICKNLLLIAGIILFTASNNYQGLIFLSDFEKAFDTLKLKVFKKH